MNECQRWTRCLTLLLVAASPWVAAAEFNEHLPVALDSLETSIQAVEANAELEEPLRKALLDYYRRAVSDIETYEANQAAMADYSSSLERAGAQAQQIERENRALRRAQGAPRLSFGPGSPTAEIAQDLLKARADLAAKEAELTRLQLRLESEQQRLPAARQELAEANSRQARGEEKPLSAGPLEGSAELRKARQWARESSSMALGSEIKKLDQELLSYGPRSQLLRARIEQSELLVAQLQGRVAAIEAALGGRRQAEADQAIAMARAAQLKAEGKHPLLVETASKNARGSDKLLEIALAIDAVSVQTGEVERRSRKVEEDFRNVRQKLELAGMNKALGRILQDQREGLPSQRALLADLRQKEGLISDITLDQLVFDEKLKALEDIPAAAGQRMQAVTDDELADYYDDVARGRAEMTAQLETLLRQRSQLYEDFAEGSEVYLQALSDFEYAQRRLLRNVKSYDDFLAERLLWVRSVPNPSLDTLLSFSGDSSKYLSVGELKHVLAVLLSPDLLTPVLLGGLLGALVLLRQRHRLQLLLQRCNRFLGNPVKDHFSFTLQALLITFLFSLPGPLVAAALGVKLLGAEEDTGLVGALAPGLLALALNWLVMRLFSQVCRPEGLAHRHFRWHAAVLPPLRRELAVLMLAFLPVGFVNVCLLTQDSSGVEWGIVRLGLIIEVVILALFFWRVLRRRGPVMESLRKGRGDVLLVRLRWLWLTLLATVPLTLVVLTAMGYVYTAATLLVSIVRMFWLLLVLVIGHQLCVRWLRLTASRLNYQNLQEERKRQLRAIFESNRRDSEFGPRLDEPEADLEHLGRDSIRLVNTVTMVAALSGTLLVWSDVLPALGYLNNVQLWDSATVFNGEAVLESITLADLGLALLVIGAAYFLYRNLPALMELVLRQFLAMSTSDRYTVITLTRYSLVMISLFSVAVLLGFEWSKFQWLAAALGLGIGFGLQEIVANFISGIIILFERPIRVGDLVTVGAVEGFVTRIRIRATTIMTYDRQELLVPNKDFITGNLLNWSLSDPISRLVVDVGVAYGSDVTRAMAIVAQIAEADEKVIADPAPFVTFEGFGDSTLNLRLRCYLDDIEARVSTMSRLRQGINERFSAEGIEIAFPQVDVHFDHNRPLSIRIERD